MSEKTSRPLRPMLWVPLAALALISILGWLTPLDMWVAQAFYGGDGTWPLGEQRLWRMLYDIGPLLGIVIGGGAFFGFIGSFFLRRLHPWRLPLIFLGLAAFVGPALVVNFIFKDHYGRPRPREVAEFGGQQRYLDVWVPGSEAGHSFPSGHCSIAFYVLTPYFVLLAWRRRMAYGFLAGGLVFWAADGAGPAGAGGALSDRCGLGGRDGLSGRSRTVLPDACASLAAAGSRAGGAPATATGTGTACHRSGGLVPAVAGARAVRLSVRTHNPLACRVGRSFDARFRLRLPCSLPFPSSSRFTTKKKASSRCWRKCAAASPRLK